MYIYHSAFNIIELRVSIFKLFILFLLGIYIPSYCTASNKDFAKIHLSVRNNFTEKLYLTEKQLLTGDEHVLYSGIIGLKALLIKIPCSKPSIIYLTFKGILTPIYIDKNAIMSIEIQLDSIPIIKFGMANASINSYLLAKKNKLDSLISKDLRLNYSMSAKGFQSLNQNIEKEIAKLRNKYLLNGVDKRFNMFDAVDISSLLIIRNLLYSDYHNYFTQERIPSTFDYKVLPSIISFDNEYGLMSKYYS